MEFKLNKEDRIKLLKLLETNEINYDISDMYLYYFYNVAIGIKKADIETMERINHLEEKDAFFYSFMSLLELDVSDLESLELAKRYCYSGIRKLDINDYLENPYLKNIKIKPTSSSNIKINYDSYLPFEGFPSDDLVVDEDNYFEEHYQLGYFDTKFEFQSITHDKITWMSIIPNEIETMKDDISKVSGNVLVYGLGLGYFAYMISLKDDVNKITIVEKDPNIIKLFKEVILPQFKEKDKIRIIQDDAYHFEKTDKSTYDFAYVDLWHGSEDGIEFYLNFKALELRSKHYLYWLEKSLVNVIRRDLITIIYEQFNKVDSSYNEAKDLNDRIINSLYKIIQNKTFSSYQEIHSLLQEESIKLLVKENKII